MHTDNTPHSTPYCTNMETASQLNEDRPKDWSEIWLALQLCDTAFPSGALANSLGLESAYHHNKINGKESFSKYTMLILEEVF